MVLDTHVKGETMNRCGQRRNGVASLLVLFAVLMMAGCGSPSPQLETSVSVDEGSRRASIECHTTRDTVFFVMFLDYPDGHREMPSSGTVGPAGGILSMDDLAPGEYAYTFHWLPPGSEDSADQEPPLDEQIVREGRTVTGTFTIP
jgi:hypothetical protein